MELAPDEICRLELNAAFGPGGWVLVPISDDIATRTWTLHVMGCHVGHATGERSYALVAICRLLFSRELPW